MGATNLNELSVDSLRGVGRSIAAKLEKLSILTVQDLLLHLPFRYQDRTRITPIRDVTQGAEAMIEAEIVASDIRYGRRRSLAVTITDGSGYLGLRFFHFSPAQRNSLLPGRQIRCFGEARVGAGGLEIYHPEYTLLRQHEQQALDDTLTPFYPTTQGITQARMRGLVQQALGLVHDDNLPDLLPAPIEGFEDLPGILDIIRYVHRPPTDAPLDLLVAGEHPYQQRLALEELLAHRLALMENRRQLRASATFSLDPPNREYEEFISRLDFELTAAQRRACDEIAEDMCRSHPMLRLVQGDVGSGKTVIAALAVFHALANGLQTAIMAPTELLAEQHLKNFSEWFSSSPVNIAWLSSNVRGKEREQRLEDIASGAAGIVIGTQALFQQKVSFARLGFIVVDEQHRFGVDQRFTFRQKGVDSGKVPHQLVMTATPIPRTLAMSLYADFELSMVDELPPGRTPVTTAVMPDDRRPEVIERVKIACEGGRQAYWICTMIDDSDSAVYQAAESTASRLSNELGGLRVALIHGRLNSDDKLTLLQRFKTGDIDVLVATTVVEVGVDVPNASLMIIENPERLGLSQLHQLRGRIGRGSTASHCILMYHAPITDMARQRLAAMRDHADGFRIAELDLKMRGPGEFLGTRQTGAVSFRIADLMRDQALLPEVGRLATAVMAGPDDVKRAIVSRWTSASGHMLQV